MSAKIIVGSIYVAPERIRAEPDRLRATVDVALTEGTRVAGEASARREPGASSSLVSWARPGRQRLFLQRCGFRVSVAYRVLRYEGDI